MPSNARRTVLIVDDDRVLCKAVSDYLSLEGVDVLTAHTGADGLALVSKGKVDVVLLDQKLPDLEGHTICAEILNRNGSIKIIFITAFPSFGNALQAIKAGAHDYITKPFELEELKLALERFFRLMDLERVEQVESYRANRERAETVLVGARGGLAGIRKLIDLAAESDSPVLITGETGTGKNVVAKTIHYSGPRKGAPFIGINCAALPENLIEAELFGYEKGAFTGADSPRKGIFEMAEGGTLFLDEIGSMPFHLQTKLLGVLEEKEVRRLGGGSARPVDVRIICATNVEIENAVKMRGFREDLYYRVSVIRVSVPPLRERLGDIPELCGYFLGRLGKGSAGLTIPATEYEALKGYSWPGNVRELKNVIERAVILQKGPAITPSELLDVRFAGGGGGAMSPAGCEDAATLDEVEKQYIQEMLDRCSGNCTKAAKMLGISLSTLKRRVKSYRLSL